MASTPGHIQRPKGMEHTHQISYPSECHSISIKNFRSTNFDCNLDATNLIRVAPIHTHTHTLRSNPSLLCVLSSERIFRRCCAGSRRLFTYDVYAFRAFGECGCYFYDLQSIVRRIPILCNMTVRCTKASAALRTGERPPKFVMATR